MNQGLDTMSMIQAALIGQTYGLLSGRPQDVIIAQSFHGTHIAWVRQCSMFQIKGASAYVDSTSVVNDPENAWKIWHIAEERNRSVFRDC
ncbi:hypothetical protein ASPACDRAFT_111273 [Aspergillus aculeatus ATCC 16872]|uniref:Uncharacterized protein n=1 Tax=Aspergillus aculeatus (strain ATCC 16872 / CBS 172.66 / WB 5094) TaxID=690307 RepID=A0A1L9X4V7_ASPA1|nr:uncharacterized protein ASPACDRAFT_111273 [Aspergillus aculeatus ATCC 16872]OJK03481.1 hypothetical protein ASPACDRAFT_111273 [Aspergillus aculeatus ATCC 16872]